MEKQKAFISMLASVAMLFSTTAGSLSVYADEVYEEQDVAEEVMLEEEDFFDESFEDSPEDFDYTCTLCDYDELVPSEEELAEIPVVTFEKSSKKKLAKSNPAPVVDLSDSFPTPINQHSQKSCTAFAVAYLKSYQEIKEHGWSASANLSHMSPSYIYNSLNNGQNTGINIKEAINFVCDNGVCSLKDMPFVESDCQTLPNDYQKRKASNFKSTEIDSVKSVEGVKELLRNGKPVIMNVLLMSDFYNISETNKVYDDNVTLTNPKHKGHHALCILGYDDTLQAFKFINSWGTNYGLGGYGYISYNLFTSNCSGIAFCMDDCEQHYKTKPLAIQAVNDMPVYVGSNMHNQKTENGQNVVISAGEKVIVNSIYKVFPGDPPVFKINGGYISAKLEDSIEAQAFTVRFVKTDGVTGNMPDQTVIFGITSHLNQNQYSRSGYTFKGWCAKRIENDVNKFLCDVDGTTKWKTYAEIQQNNYPLHIYRDEAPLARTSPIPNDIVYMYPQWTKNS